MHKVMQEKFKIGNWIIIAGGIIFLLFYFIFDPMDSSWMPQCIFHKLTGMQCMGCGSQRMLHHLLHGDFSSAWQANAFLLLMLPVFAFYVIIEIFRKKFNRIYSSIHNRFTIYGAAGLLAVWFVVRNLTGM